MQVQEGFSRPRETRGSWTKSEDSILTLLIERKLPFQAEVWGLIIDMVGESVATS
jgi:hypothetical protein